MKSKLLPEDNGLRTFALVFDKNDEVREQLLNFANLNRFADAHVTAIGAFSEDAVGFFDRQKKAYKNIAIKEQVEVLSFTGNIVAKDTKPALHAHVVVGKQDGTAHGGHFLGGRVWPTLEMIVSEMPVHLRRSHDDNSDWPSSTSPPKTPRDVFRVLCRSGTALAKFISGAALPLHFFANMPP